MDITKNIQREIKRAENRRLKLEWEQSEISHYITQLKQLEKQNATQATSNEEKQKDVHPKRTKD